MKLITFTVPCYNSAEYMDRCVNSLLKAGSDAEIILVDDGSTDATGDICDRYAAQYPDMIRVIHQENGGHGAGVNQGIRNAQGLYFKIVDSDDWLDDDGLSGLMALLRSAALSDETPDMIIADYVYEHVEDNTQHVVRYRNALPTGRNFGWDEVGRLTATQFITMHSVVYLTRVLRESGLSLPRHTFYVDNIYVYQPMPLVHRLYYMDAELYHYYIGRADQSVTEENLIRRIDQQILVAKILADSHDLEALKRKNRRLASYLYHYLSIIMMICTIYLMKSGTPENLKKADALWQWLKDNHPATYRRLRYRSANFVFVISPGRVGRSIDLFIYRALRRIYKFN